VAAAGWAAGQIGESAHTRQRVSAKDPHVTIVGARTDGLNGVGWPFLTWTSSNMGGTTRCHVRASDARARRMSD